MECQIHPKKNRRPCGPRKKHYSYQKQYFSIQTWRKRHRKKYLRPKHLVTKPIPVFKQRVIFSVTDIHRNLIHILRPTTWQFPAGRIIPK